MLRLSREQQLRWRVLRRVLRPGPGAGVAWLILEGHHGAALGVLAVAGVSDWADGYVAKRWGQASVVGSYLDPAADKVLIGCTVAALAYEARPPARLGRKGLKDIAALLPHAVVIVRVASLAQGADIDAGVTRANHPRCACGPAHRAAPACDQARARRAPRARCRRGWRA